MVSLAILLVLLGFAALYVMGIPIGEVSWVVLDSIREKIVTEPYTQAFLAVIIIIIIGVVLILKFRKGRKK